VTRRGQGRPKGNAPWTPSAESRERLRQVEQVFALHGPPLGSRQVCYRLVGEHGLAKTDAAFSSVERLLVRARRAGLLPWEWIADDRARELPGEWLGYSRSFVPEHLDGEVCRMRASLRGWRERAVASYRRDPFAGQPDVLEVWCEAAAMVERLAAVVGPLGVSVVSSSGQHHVGPIHGLAERALAVEREGRRLVVLHVGDLDPTGVDIPRVLREDVRAFGPRRFVAEPLAATQAQAVELGLPTSVTPVKPRPGKRRTDPRMARWVAERLGAGPDGTEAVQAEAVPPGAMEALLREAVERHLDRNLVERVRAEEEAEHAELRRMVAELPALSEPEP
jgi:hypothetical protein